MAWLKKEDYTHFNDEIWSEDKPKFFDGKIDWAIILGTIAMVVVCGIIYLYNL